MKSEARLRVALFCAGFATFLQIFDAQAVIASVIDAGEASAATAALLVSAPTFALAASVIPWSVAGDSFGPVRMMRLALAVAVVCALVAPLLPTLEAMIVVRTVMGAALGGVPALALTHARGRAPGTSLAVLSAVYTAGNTIGGVTGRLAAGLLASWVDWRWGLIAASTFGLVAGVIFVFVVPDDRRDRPAVSVLGATTAAMKATIRHLRSRALVPVYGIGFLTMGAFTVVYNLLGVHLIGIEPSLDSGLVSLLFLAYLVGTPVARWSASLAQRIGGTRTMRVGFTGLVGGLALMSTSALWSVVSGLLLFTAATFLIQPIAGATAVAAASRGANQSAALYQLSWLLGAAVLGVLGAALFGMGGWMFSVGLCGAAVIFAGLLSLVPPPPATALVAGPRQ